MKTENEKQARQLLDTIRNAIDDIDKRCNPCDPTRPYDGQPHTDQGKRGETMVKGLTMRDVFDCFVIGWLNSSMRGHLVEANACDYRDLYEGDDVDPLAVGQNMMCAIEKRMGIYPNVPQQEAPDERMD